jgi:ADP-heptose:LPS heptosyltransferase
MPLRSLARTLRNRLEGLFFRLWCVFNRVPIDNARRRLMCRQGLKHLREAYWTLFVLEKYRTLWRYVLLIEWFATRDRRDVSVSIQERKPQRILFIRLSHFGDLLHLVPLLRSVRKASPDSELDLLVGPWGRDVAERIPYIDHVLTYAPRLYHLNRGNTGECLSWRQEKEFGRQLAERKYDVVVATHGAGLVELALIHAAQANQWLGPPAEYNDLQPFARQVIAPFEKDLYEATRMVRLGRYLGCELDDDTLEFWIAPEEEAQARVLLEQCEATASGWVVICPGAGWPGKQWPLDRYAQIADCVIEKTGLKVLIAGAASERSMGQQMASLMSQPSVNVMGQTSWGVLAALIRDARLFIGGDSGPMHLTAVYGTPCVCLFGPTKPEQWAPRGPHARIIRNVQSCPDCWPWHPGRDCVHDRACMKAIEVAEVWEAICERLETGEMTNG